VARVPLGVDGAGAGGVRACGGSGEVRGTEEGVHLERDGTGDGSGGVRSGLLAEARAGSSAFRGRDEGAVGAGLPRVPGGGAVADPSGDGKAVRLGVGGVLDSVPAEGPRGLAGDAGERGAVVHAWPGPGLGALRPWLSAAEGGLSAVSFRPAALLAGAPA